MLLYFRMTLFKCLFISEIQSSKYLHNHYQAQLLLTLRRVGYIKESRTAQISKKNVKINH